MIYGHLVIPVGILLLALSIVGIGTAGADSADLVIDPVSTIGHVCDEWGIHNNGGNHQHGDS
jgi:hypothetical protein